MIIQEEEDVNGRQGGVEMKKAEEEGRERDRQSGDRRKHLIWRMVIKGCIPLASVKYCCQDSGQP